MLRPVALAGLAGLLLVTAGLAEEKKQEKAVKKPIGTWTRQADGVTLTFAVRENDMTITVKVNDDSNATIEASYGVTKDGVAFGYMTKVTSKGLDKAPEKGSLFSMSYSVSDKEMTMSDFKGTHANDDSRKLVEGVYTKK